MNPQDWQIHFWTVLVVMGPEGTLDAVEIDRPRPGEELNTGAPTEPRQAATVIVLRGGAERLEVLLVRRNPAARFMGGAWVFPGGAVDAGEDHRVRRRARGGRGGGRRRCRIPAALRGASRAGSPRRR